MTDILTPNSLDLSHFMCSSSGNLPDHLASYPGHSPSCVLDSEPEPDSTSRQQDPSPLPPDNLMGMRYMTLPTTDDVRFNHDTGTSHHSPVYSTNASSLNFLPYATQNIYQQPSLGSSSSYASSSTGSYYSQNPSIFSMPDLKPRLGASLHSSPVGMAPPTRSPLPHPTSPISGTIRPIYASHTPSHTSHIRRESGMVSRSPSALGGGAQLSPTSSGFTSPTMENSLNSQSPPLQATEVIHQLQASDGQIIRPEIYGKIDKGFFMADNDWTCYRRNYFSLNCSYSLLPAIPTGTIHLVQHGGSSSQVYGFALSIAAVVDGRDGKAIELVQHTPKRDKGPQEKPGRIPLAPRPPPPIGMYGGDSALGASRSMYDQGFGPNPGQPATEATFERIQFKNATANNGKRRAAQQYYHLLVELFADVGSQHPDRWIKIATRMSAPMVVRGRSPGHYQSERRGSNASTGPGGSGGAGGAGSYTPGGSTSRTPGDVSMSGTSLISGNNYSSSYDGRSHHHYRSSIAPLQIPMEPTLSAEEAKSIEDAPCYMYYPGPIYEGHEGRFSLPSVSEYTTSKIKSEFSSGGGGNTGQYVLPSLASTQEFGGRCGRWEGAAESKGYFPTALIQQQMNIT